MGRTPRKPFVVEDLLAVVKGKLLAAERLRTAFNQPLRLEGPEPIITLTVYNREGGLHARRFELSSTTRNRVPIEHIELATALAETLALEYDIPLPPVTAAEVEAAYLRRMKAKGAELGPPQQLELPRAVEGKPVAEYRVNNIVATLLHGGPDFAYIAPVPSASNNGKEEEEMAVLLQRNEQKGVMIALPVVKGRPRRGSPLMTTPLAEVVLSEGAWLRALAAWGGWLVWALN